MPMVALAVTWQERMQNGAWPHAYTNGFIRDCVTCVRQGMLAKWGPSWRV